MTEDRDTSPEHIRFLIERLYIAHEEADSSFGAQRWFARTSGYDDRTVRGWIQRPQRSTPQPVVFNFIDRMEEMVGRRALNRAERVLKREEEEEDEQEDESG